MELFGHSEATTRRVVPLPVACVLPDPQQPRKTFDPEALQALAESVRAEGLLQPIAVRPALGRPNCYLIIGGERRWRAHQLAGLPTIDAEIHQISERKARSLALLENLNREGLNPLEEAQGIRDLLDLGVPLDDIAKGIGKKPATIEYEQRLLTLDTPVQDLLRTGHLSRQIGLKLTKLSPQGQRKALQRIGGKDAEAAGAVIDALFAEEHQRDLFAEALDEAHGNRVAAIGRRWDRFAEAARLLVRTLLSPDDYRLVPAVLRVDLGRRLAELDLIIKALARIRREMQRYHLQRAGGRRIARGSGQEARS
jgi:ParB family chromosome partitioning protein